MKNFLIFVVGLLIGGVVVYYTFPYTAKSQGVVEAFLEMSDQSEQEGDTLNIKAQPLAVQPAQQTRQETEQPKRQVTSSQPKQGLGKIYFENEIEFSGRKSFKVNKVLESGDAMATEVTMVTSNGIAFTTAGTEVLLEYNPGMPYYDSQVVEVASKQKTIQVGIYRYDEYSSVKTLPILVIR